MLALRDAVVFPQTMVPFVVGRKSSLEALRRAKTEQNRIFLVCQRDPAVDEPTPHEVHTVGTIAEVVQSLEVKSGNLRVLVSGLARARSLEVRESDEGGFLVAEVRTLPTIAGPQTADEIRELAARVVNLFEEHERKRRARSSERVLSGLDASDPERVADTVAAQIVLPAEMKQDLLERLMLGERLLRLEQLIVGENEKLDLDRKISDRVRGNLEKSQKEYFLQEKIKAIQQELGQDGTADPGTSYRAKIAALKLPAEVREKADAEVRRLQAMPPMSAEATVCRTYLDWLIDLPWSKKTREKRDIVRARAVLDEDHFGLDEVKERILEFLAVRRLAPGQPQKAILCFVGPPGVGKTSLAQSIARATGRRFARVSLGGVRDEAEVRGHRRTYVGALPGRVIQMLKKAGSKNPVFLLDEIDKMSTDFRGDPSSALLEVLDPEQNHEFLDHYLDTGFDLSDVFFIATANVTHTIPGPLRDRMEIIRIAGYTLSEKLAIGERFLVPRMLGAHGLARRKVEITPAALKVVIERYTREAGVRSLERELAKVCRKIARKLVEEGWSGNVVDAAEIEALLGVPRYRALEARDRNEVGVATGLAWTAVGGAILLPEVAAVPGRGKFIVTGKIGDVMQESAQAAWTYVRSRASAMGLEEPWHESHDLHVHVPEGAIPKDGPSAGSAIAAAIVSLLTGTPARADVAMTGEITLRGAVLPVGGVKEKVLAAHRCGITHVILPRENEQDLAEVPADVLEEMRVHLVEHMDEVLPLALESPPKGWVLSRPADADENKRAH